MTYSLGPLCWPTVDLGHSAPRRHALQCGGRQFDASNGLHDGWACVAVEASDKLGNKQVSRPIRICVVGTPGSTACTATASGGADIASVTLPSTLSGNVVVTTKAPVLGKNGAAVAKGDTLIFSNASPCRHCEPQWRPHRQSSGQHGDPVPLDRHDNFAALPLDTSPRSKRDRRRHGWGNRLCLRGDRRACLPGRRGNSSRRLWPGCCHEPGLSACKQCQSDGRDRLWSIEQRSVDRV
jgi:hypothetical protein